MNPINQFDQFDQFDQEHADALRSIWVLGDVHGAFGHIVQALLAASDKLRWLVFLGTSPSTTSRFARCWRP